MAEAKLRITYYCTGHGLGHATRVLEVIFLAFKAKVFIGGSHILEKYKEPCICHIFHIQNGLKI